MVILFDIEGANNGEMEPRVPKPAVEITKVSRITLEWEEMFEGYVISLSKFKSEE